MLPFQLVHDLAAIPGWGAGFGMLLIKATIILGAGVAITRSMNRSSAGARHLVWLAILGILLAMPALTTWARVEIRMLPPSNATLHAARGGPTTVVVQARPASAGLPSIQAATLAADEIQAAPDPGTSGPLAGSGIPWVPLVIGIWAVVTLVILTSLVWSAFGVRQIVRRSKTLEESAWRIPLLEVADRLALHEPPRLVASCDTKMPFACGVLAPTIVLPAECMEWPSERRRAVLLHELAHVQRRDLVGHVLGRVACAFYWFHPLVWVAAKGLRLESERACDDLALACGTRATDYAEHLLDIVVAVRASATPVVALAMARRKEFEGRMLAILDPELRHSTPSRGQSAALVASLALSAGLIAAVAPVPRSVAAVRDELAPEAHSIARSAVRDAGANAHQQAGSAPATARRSVGSTTTLAGAEYVPPVMNRTSVSAPSAAVTTQDAGPADQGAPDDRTTLLAKILRSDSSAKLRRIAAWGLEGHTDNTAAVDALVNAVRHDADGSVREMAAWSLGSSDGYGEVITALSAALRSDANEKVRVTAAWALGNVGADASADVLRAALSDSSRDVRLRAAWALGNGEPKQAPPALVKMLADGDREARQLAAWALFQIQDPSALPALEAALRKETDEDTQLAYLRAIAVMGDKSIDVIRGLLESPDPGIKSMAVRALAGGHATGPWPWPWPEPRPEP